MSFENLWGSSLFLVNIKRTAALAGFAIISSLTLTLFGTPAQADPIRYNPGGSDGCTITDIAPETAVIGIAGKRVQFDVETDCDSTEDVKWAVQGALYPGANHVGWFGACTYSYTGPASLDCGNNGSGIIDPINYGRLVGDLNAGKNTIYAYAFVDKNHNGYDDDHTSCDYDDADDCADQPQDRDWDTGTINILRRTTFSSSFDAAPEPRRKGQRLEMDAQLYVADWDSGTYARQGGLNVKVQFRATGASSFKNVATVKTRNDGTLTYQTKATMSGYWRMAYQGNKHLAPANSNSDYVKVNAVR